MSADTALRGSVCMLLLGACTVPQAADETAPDMEFIEYLGMWEQSDEEWQFLEGRASEELDERVDEEAQEEEPVEREDEN